MEKNPIDLYYDMKDGRIKLAQKADNSGASLLNMYLAMLRGLYIIYQHGHWKCAGSNFYGNHLLFNRIYDDVSDLSDSVAEKLIGLYGNEALNHKEQASIISEFVSKFEEDSVVENAFTATKVVLEFSDDLFNRLKEMGELSLGLDDLIMSNSSKLETFKYLLQQAKA